MNRELSTDRALDIIENAFAPLTCKASLQNHGNYISAELTPENGDHLAPVEFTHQQFSDAGRLALILRNTRETLRNNGIDLDDWAFPDLENADK